jgi:hypothetical protein
MMNQKSMTFFIVIVVLLVVAWYYMKNYSKSTPKPMKPMSREMTNFADVEEGMQGDMEVEGAVVEPATNRMTGELVDPALEQLRQASCFPKQQLTPDDLLPKDTSSLWAQMNPNGAGSLKDRNFLQSGYHIGINTVGQTLRNANLQIRSEPPNPQVAVSPWLNSTIEPDINRRPFEIGGCA